MTNAGTRRRWRSLRILRPRSSIWHEDAYVRLWVASTVSQTGSQLTLLALPFVAIATLKATTFEVAALGVMDFAPLLLFALPAGVWIDRMRRRPVMVAADIGRAIALASIPAAYAADVLTIWQLFAVGFVTGTLTVFFDVASQSFLPTVLKRDDLADGNAALQVGGQGAQLVGPALAGLLVSALGAPLTILADAVSFVGSAGFIARVRAHETPAPGTRQRMKREIADGLRYVRDHPIIRPTMVFTAVANIFNSILFAVFLLFAVRTLGMSAREIGLVLALSNAGSLIAAVMITRLQQRLGIGRVILVSAFSGWALLLIPFASGPLRVPLLAAAMFAWGAGVVIYNASTTTIIQATTPDRLLARVNASRRLVVWGMVPVATLLGGLIGTYFGLRSAVLVGASGRALAGLIILMSPVRAIRTLSDADALVSRESRGAELSQR